MYNNSRPKRLNILQYNLNKSLVAQEDLTQSDTYKYYDMILIQEPYINYLGNMRATNN